MVSHTQRLHGMWEKIPQTTSHVLHYQNLLKNISYHSKIVDTTKWHLTSVPDIPSVSLLSPRLCTGMVENSGNKTARKTISTHMVELTDTRTVSLPGSSKTTLIMYLLLPAIKAMYVSGERRERFTG